MKWRLGIFVEFNAKMYFIFIDLMARSDISLIESSWILLISFAV